MHTCLTETDNESFETSAWFATASENFGLKFFLLSRYMIVYARFRRKVQIPVLENPQYMYLSTWLLVWIEEILECWPCEIVLPSVLPSSLIQNCSVFYFQNQLYVDLITTESKNNEYSSSFFFSEELIAHPIGFDLIYFFVKAEMQKLTATLFW